MVGRVGRVLGGYFRRRAVTYFFVIIIFVMGSVFGAYAVKALSPQQRSELVEYVQSFFQSFDQERRPDGPRAIRQSVIDNIVKTVGLMWVLGLSVLGVPFILVIIFLRGFVLGFTVGFMVKEMVLKGMALAVVSVVPHNLLVVPAIVLAGGASVSFSLAAFRTLLGRRDINVLHQFLGTTLLAALACGLLVVAVLVEAYVTPALIEVANRYLG